VSSKWPTLFAAAKSDKKETRHMVIIDFAAIAMGLPLSLSRFFKKIIIYPASLLDTTNSVFVTSQDE